jgi:hypothetical protein
MNSNWDFLHNWYMPFLWLTLSAAISIGTAIYFQIGMPLHPGAELGLAYGDGWVLRDDFLATIVVYLLNLGCAIWLLDSDGSTRWAAFWASLLSIARIAVPVSLATMSDVTLASGQHYIDWHTLRIVIWVADIQLFFAGLMLWGVFAHFVGQSSSSFAESLHAEAY